ILQHAVNTLHLLLLTQLHAVAGELLLPRLPVLPRRTVALLNRALFRVAAFPLEEQLHALAAAQTANGSDVSSHESHSPTLGRAAAVVRNGRHIADRFHLDANRLQRANRGFASRTRALHLHLDRAQSIGLRGVAGVDSR